MTNTIAFEHSIYEIEVSSGVLKGFVEMGIRLRILLMKTHHSQTFKL
ncbi:MAG: hypothetical protein H7A23_18970 [Leptospiraceae bacterium]|nr:hypothetical protein [Leptospiraceae bacterium]MCP5496636.1 hypothetical protein [Leptospiraceae bacterium]